MRKTGCTILLKSIRIAALNLGMATLVTAAPEPFHNGSIGNCEGCHQTLTGNVADSRSASFSPGSTGFMLKGSDASSTCLFCHEAPVGILLPQEYYVATNAATLAPGSAPNQLTPGGDFGWLKKDYCWPESDQGSGRGTACSLGERHGHNIIAKDFAYYGDSRNVSAPGGTFRSRDLSCTSCHDPHGDYKRFPDGVASAPDIKAAGSGSYTNSPDTTSGMPVGTYRLLAGKGYTPKGADTTFKFDPPVALAPPSYNRRESFTETRVAYGSGMSEWCKNCHPQIHGNRGIEALAHPSGEGVRLSQSMIMNYDAYISSGNMNGSTSTAYSSLTPFEMGTNDYAELKKTANSNGSNKTGPGTNAQVMCLSCHRAHASGWDSMMRWDAASTYIVVNGNYPGIDNSSAGKYAHGRTSQEIMKAFYGRPASKFSEYQRSLCKKCHSDN